MQEEGNVEGFIDKEGNNGDRASVEEVVHVEEEVHKEDENKSGNDSVQDFEEGLVDV